VLARGLRGWSSTLPMKVHPHGCLLRTILATEKWKTRLGLLGIALLLGLTLGHADLYKRT
jgi:hypothetical protein